MVRKLKYSIRGANLRHPSALEQLRDHRGVVNAIDPIAARPRREDGAKRRIGKLETHLTEIPHIRRMRSR